MKRRNIQLAFVGEGSVTGEEAVEEIVHGDEAIDLVVTGGSLMLVVPAGTPDEQIFEGASLAGGELVLENGLRFSFEIKAEAVGARFSATAQEPDESHQGLSELPDIPAAV
jgi:hypothetical protein